MKMSRRSYLQERQFFVFVFGTLSFWFNEDLLEAVQSEKITDRKKIYM